MFFKEIQAIHCCLLRIHDRQMMCPAISLDKFVRMAHRNILPISKSKFVVFLDHQAKSSNAKITQTVLGPSHVRKYKTLIILAIIASENLGEIATQPKKDFAVKKNLIRWLYDVAWKEWHHNT